MRELGLRGVRRGKAVRTTTPDADTPRPADLVERDWASHRHFVGARASGPPSLLCENAGRTDGW